MRKIGAHFFLFLIFISLTSNTTISQIKNEISQRDTVEGWHQLNIETNQSFQSISIFKGNGDSDRVIAVGDNGTIFNSPDAGETWEAKQSGTTNNLTSVSFQRDANGYTNVGIAVGENGTILRTEDGGNTWTSQTIPGVDFNSVFYSRCPATGQTIAYAVGDNAKIYSSTDGQNWSQQATEFQFDDLYGVHFYNAFTGWIVGTNGIIYKTSNGGSNWSYVAGLHSNPNWYSVFMKSPTDIYMVGAFGTIAHTTNGGSTFTQVQSGTTEQLNDLHLGSLDPDTAANIIVGNNGTVLQQENGSTNWQQTYVGTNENLYCVTNDIDGYAWIVGANGTVITNRPEGTTPTAAFVVTPQSLNFSNRQGVTKWKNDSQSARVTINSDSDLSWTVSSSVNWISVYPAGGTNSGSFKVWVNADELSSGRYTGTVTINCPGANPSSQSININLTVIDSDSGEVPIGELESPLNGATVSGSVPVTGWALDDVGIDQVKIFNGSIYLGDAVFVEGSRPDIGEQYQDFPQNQTAGWQYNLLSDMLPGAGPYTISASVTDLEGHDIDLGSSVIYRDSDYVAPVGGIDTPKPGQKISGTSFNNSGWVITPTPNKIPEDGSTIYVEIDGVNVGNPAYNGYRQDISNLFPNCSNSQGSAASYQLNTTQFSDGLHTIEWRVTDDAGNSQGIGSRYFTISNTGDFDASSGIDQMNFGHGDTSVNLSKRNFNVTNAYGPYVQVFQINVPENGMQSWQVESEFDWITLEPTSGTGSGWVLVTVNPTGLTIGEHVGHIKINDSQDETIPEFIKVTLRVYDSTEPPFGEFSTPAINQIVSGMVNLSGWALDDVGVDEVKIYRTGGQQKIFLGNANFVDLEYSEIANFYAPYPNTRHACWAFNFLTNSLTDGDYIFTAEVIDFEGKKSILQSNLFTINNSNAASPFGDIDTPNEGQVISGESYVVTGWALTPQPAQIVNNGSGIEIFIDGEYAGNPEYNIERQDIAAQFPGYLNSNGAGITFNFNTVDYEDGVHSIWMNITDNLNHTSEKIGARNFNIQNTSDITDIEEETIPDETILLPAYPNPFNPHTNIIFRLATDAFVNVYIYDILGNKIATLIENEFKPSGSYNIHWNSKNDNQVTVSSGIYFLLLKTDNYKKTQKLLLLR